MYVFIYIYIYNTELLDGNKGHQEETHHPTHRFRRLFFDLLSMGWRGCASAMGVIKLPPSCSSPKIMCQSIHIVNICSRGVFAVNNSELRLQWNVFATIDRRSIMTGMYRRSMMIYSSPYVRLQNLPWYKTGLVSRQVLHLLSKLQNWLWPKTGQCKTCLVSNTKIGASIQLLNPNPDTHTLPPRQSKYLFKMKRQV